MRRDVIFGSARLVKTEGRAGPTLRVVLNPFYGHMNGRDSQGTYFSPRTNFHLDLFPVVDAPVFGAHNGALDPSVEGYGELTSMASEVFDVAATERGLECTVELDRAHSKTDRYVQAAEAGYLYVSSACSPEVYRVASDGEILDWGNVGISLVDMTEGFSPANMLATAQLLSRTKEAGMTPEQMAEEQRKIAREEFMRMTTERADAEKKAAEARAAQDAEVQRRVDAELQKRNMTRGSEQVASQPHIGVPVGSTGRGEAADLAAWTKRNPVSRKTAQDIGMALAFAMNGRMDVLQKLGYQTKAPQRMDEFLAQIDDPAVREYVKASPIGSATGTSGAFYLRPAQVQEVFVAPMQQAWLLSLLTPIMPGVNVDEVEMTQITNYDQSAPDTTGLYGGVVVYNIQDGRAPQLSQVKSEQMTIRAYQKGMYTIMSKTWMEQSAETAASFILDKFRVAGTLSLQRDALWGNGVGKSSGMLNTTANPAIIPITRAGAGHLAKADIDNSMLRMLDSSLEGPDGGPVPTLRWVGHRSIEPDLSSLVDAASNQIWLSPFEGMYRSVLPRTIRGVPLIMTSAVPTLGNASDLSLIDFAYYGWHMPGEFSFTVFNELRGLTNEAVPFGILRAGGRSMLASVVTPEYGDTQSAFVTMAA